MRGEGPTASDVVVERRGPIADDLRGCAGKKIAGVLARADRRVSVPAEVPL